MDADVCTECGGGTRVLSSSLELPGSGTVTRRWRECSTCGWESLYEDTVSR